MKIENSYTLDHVKARKRFTEIEIKVEKELKVCWDCCTKKARWDLVNDDVFFEMADSLAQVYGKTETPVLLTPQSESRVERVRENQGA